MNINFPAVDENYIKTKVADGFYSNATELVRDAVRRLREQDDEKYDRIMAAIEVGERDVREGRVELYTPELMDRIVQDAIEHVAAGRPLDPDVCP